LGQAAGISSKAPIHVFTRSDAAGVVEIWAKHLGKKQEDLLGVGVFGELGLATAVKKDAVGIGFNNIVYAYDAKTKKTTNGVTVIPNDLNKNEIIDANENFYDNIDMLIDAITTGK
jgi:phosphate transport system substrate-binding protein